MKRDGCLRSGGGRLAGSIARSTPLGRLPFHAYAVRETLWAASPCFSLAQTDADSVLVDRLPKAFLLARNSLRWLTWLARHTCKVRRSSHSILSHATRADLSWSLALTPSSRSSLSFTSLAYAHTPADWLRPLASKYSTPSLPTQTSSPVPPGVRDSLRSPSSHSFSPLAHPPTLVQMLPLSTLQSLQTPPRRPTPQNTLRGRTDPLSSPAQTPRASPSSAIARRSPLPGQGGVVDIFAKLLLSAPARATGGVGEEKEGGRSSLDAKVNSGGDGSAGLTSGLMLENVFPGAYTVCRSKRARLTPSKWIRRLALCSSARSSRHGLAALPFDSARPLTVSSCKVDPGEPAYRTSTSFLS